MRILIFTIILAITTVLSIQANAGASSTPQSKTIILQQTPKENTEHDNETEFKGTRSPALPLVCTITASTIEIPGIDINIVESFEVYSIDGTETERFNDLSQFCSFVMSHDNGMEIRLVTPVYIYIGWILKIQG